MRFEGSREGAQPGIEERSTGGNEENEEEKNWFSPNFRRFSAGPYVHPWNIATSTF